MIYHPLSAHIRSTEYPLAAGAVVSADGQALVATNVGGITMIVKEGETALLSDISLEQFSKNLYKLIENK